MSGRERERERVGEELKQKGGDETEREREADLEVFRQQQRVKCSMQAGYCSLDRTHMQTYTHL